MTKALVRPVSTIAPISATPREEPSCCPVYCRPPASARPEASTEDCTTLPSWDAMRPIPTPRIAIETANPASLSSGSIVASRISTASTVVVEPGPDDPAHREAGRQPRAGRGGQEHGDRDGQHLDAGLQGVEAEHELQVQRHHEEDAHEDEVLAEQPDQARAQRQDPQQAQVHERVGAGLLPVALPHRERPQQDGAADDHPDGQGEAQRGDRGVLRHHPAPGARLQRAEHDDAQAHGRQDRAQVVQPRFRPAALGVGDLAGHGEDEDDQHDLTGEDDPPAELRRGPATEDRPTAMPAPETPPITA